MFNALIRKQMRNAWTLIVRLPGCDAAPVRFMVMQDTDDSLKTIRVNRGISYASDSLISDTLSSAWGAADIVLSRTGSVARVPRVSNWA
ncbi:hypothetical protein [Sphingopyxis sp. BSNA05]|uniref:hypothetical protein n=1 Tax=Sphingopyxis sp. BSNA05 TaxID=1236614 RepID=UPI001566813F|nr:hypothetical protein [Sphingopyxis sp. BSNA05]